MESLAALSIQKSYCYLTERTRDVLARFKLDALRGIHSGELFSVFLDDPHIRLKVNPQF